MSDAIQSEAEERRRGHDSLTFQIDAVRGEVQGVKSDVAAVKGALARVQKDTRILRVRAKRDVGGMREEMAKCNRRLAWLVFAALVYTCGAVPEVREVAKEIIVTLAKVAKLL